MQNWIDLLENEDLKHLHKSGKSGRFSAKAYELIQDDIIKYFGISPQFKLILKNKIKIELLRCEIIEDGDLTRLIFMERLEQQNEEILKNEVKSDIYEALFYIEKQLHFKINPKLYTVFDFYSHTKFIQKQLKQG